MIQKISDKLINHLQQAKTANGKIGSKVKPVENETNKAWISISAKKEYDARVSPIQEKVICYEIEYVELNQSYDTENEFDFDVYLVKREIFYNLKDISQVEETLKRWVNDFSVIEPISNVSYPML